MGEVWTGVQTKRRCEHWRSRSASAMNGICGCSWIRGVEGDGDVVAVHAGEEVVAVDGGLIRRRLGRIRV